MNANEKLLALEVIESICQFYDISPAKILGRSRVQELCNIRAIIARVLRDLRYTLFDIGVLLNRSHAAVWVLIDHTHHYPDLSKRVDIINSHFTFNRKHGKS